MVANTSTGSLRCWKYSQLTCYLVAFICAVVCSATLGTVVEKFDGRCLLFTQIKLVLEKNCDNCSTTVIRVDSGDSESDDTRLWEAKATCDFPVFSAVGASIYAFILAYFILMCDRTERISQGSGSRNRMTNLFFPLLLISLVFAILMLVSSVRILHGSQIFCDAVMSSIKISCSEAQYYKWKDFIVTDYFYTTLVASIATAWICTAAYILSVIILILRCSLGVDYTVVYIGKLIESRSISEKSFSRDYGSATSCPVDVHQTSSLSYDKDFEPVAGPSSASI
ncbi:hypothetical protein CHUAL_009475 [Chamberlinius hualienensis]